ncbi:MAG TPA: YfcE family phosphodiesterase, partial [Spirochaetia bacterium]|nr:YfcE family phosphodiesterase [Spirochaetia bacterium]
MSRLLAFSDIHGSVRRVEKVIGSISPFDGILIAGDITQKGGRREADEILRLFTGLP